MSGKKSAEVKLARDLVIKQGMSLYAAAKLAGCNQSSVARDPEVKKYREGKKNAAKTS